MGLLCSVCGRGWGWCDKRLCFSHKGWLPRKRPCLRVQGPGGAAESVEDRSGLRPRAGRGVPQAQGLHQGQEEEMFARTPTKFRREWGNWTDQASPGLGEQAQSQGSKQPTACSVGVIASACKTPSFSTTSQPRSICSRVARAQCRMSSRSRSWAQATPGHPENNQERRM